MSDTTKDLEFINFHRRQHTHGVALRDHFAFRWFLVELEKRREALRGALSFNPLLPNSLEPLNIAGIRAQLHMLDNLVSEDGIRCPMVERIVNDAKKVIPNE